MAGPPRILAAALAALLCLAAAAAGQDGREQEPSGWTSEPAPPGDPQPERKPPDDPAVRPPAQPAPSPWLTPGERAARGLGPHLPRRRFLVEVSLIDQALPLLGVRELAVTSWMAGVGVRGAFEALSFLRVDMRMDAGTPAFSLESFYEVSGWWLQTSLGLELGVGRKARFFVRPGLSLELMDFERREEEVFTGEPEEIWKVKSTEPGVCLGAGFSVAMSDRMGLQLFLHLNYALTPHEGTYTRYWPLSPDQRYRITSRLSFLFSVAFHVRF